MISVRSEKDNKDWYLKIYDIAIKGFDSHDPATLHSSLLIINALIEYSNQQFFTEVYILYILYI